MFTVTINNL